MRAWWRWKIQRDPGSPLLPALVILIAVWVAVMIWWTGAL